MFEGVWKESLDEEQEHRFPLLLWEDQLVRSVVVIHQGALGDFILALPSFETIRKTFPRAKLVIIGYPRIVELVDQRFYVGKILSIDQKEMASLFVRGGPLDPNLSQLFGQFDLIVLFGRDEDGTIIENLESVCHGKILHIHPFPSWGREIHLTDHLLRQFSRYGFLISCSTPRLYLKESDRDWGRRFWQGKGVNIEERSRAIILHPGSGSKRKVWPLERFLSLSQILRDRLGSKILIILGPAEETEMERVFGEMDPQAFIQAKGFSLLQIASLMEKCRAFIGNDSGISHMASALGIPTIAIFGPTDPGVWAPRGEKVLVVRRETPCSPCTRERLLQCGDLECLKGIGTEEVLKGLEKVGVST